METCGYLYNLPFIPSSSQSNLAEHKHDSGYPCKFPLTATFTVTQSMILVVTTYHPDDVGEFNISIHGPAQLSLTPYISTSNIGTNTNEATSVDTIATTTTTATTATSTTSTTTTTATTATSTTTTTLIITTATTVTTKLPTTVTTKRPTTKSTRRTSTKATRRTSRGTTNNPTRPTITTPTTVTATPPGIQSSYSGALTKKSSSFMRPKQRRYGFYFLAIEVTISSSGIYTIVCESSIDTYGCLYNESFLPNNPNSKLIATDDDSGSKKNFKLVANLTTTESLILVVTTYNAEQTGAFKVIVYGPEKAILTPYVTIPLTTTRTSTTTSTSTSTTTSTTTRPTPSRIE
ncbi:unnamed protein product, partial [Rotaria socialis]